MELDHARPSQAQLTKVKAAGKVLTYLDSSSCSYFEILQGDVYSILEKRNSLSKVQCFMLQKH